MKSYAKEVQNLLSGALTVNVYADVVPEEVPLPAIAWYNIGYTNGRVVNGVKTSDQAVFRVMVVVESLSQLDDILAELELLDNTSNTDFNMINITGNNLEAKAPESPVRRYMADLSLTV